MSTLLTVQEAADAARCDPRVIRGAIKAGELEALFSSRWLIDEGAVTAWMGERARQRLSVRPKRSQARRRQRARDDRAGSVVRLQAMRGEQA